jgi:hypothetical protein
MSFWAGVVAGCAPGEPGCGVEPPGKDAWFGVAVLVETGLAVLLMLAVVVAVVRLLRRRSSHRAELVSPNAAPASRA